MKQGKTILELAVGDFAECKKVLLDKDVVLFSEVSGDKNPVHLDEEYASTTRFKHRIVHGHLVASLFSALLGTELPGQGSIYLGQTIKYLKPVYLNDEIRAVVKVIECDTEKNRVKLETNAYNQNNEMVITGLAEIMPPR
ncbi:MAG TPA: MaoC family dehydratase [Erysipelotrichaceae bacterium]|nr:MaoC family dehydratase [Erysipelotrichaceae bacterium]